MFVLGGGIGVGKADEGGGGNLKTRKNAGVIYGQPCNEKKYFWPRASLRSKFYTTNVWILILFHSDRDCL